MSRFFEALKREAEQSNRVAPSGPAPVRAVRLASVPTVHNVPAQLARTEPVSHIGEQLSVLASTGEGCRLFVTGCDPGDGVSSVATALALDVSQRFGLTTALVDAHLQHPSLQNLFGRNDVTAIDAGAKGLVARPSGLPRLDLLLSTLGQSTDELIDEIQAALPNYRTAVADLGVVRLEPVFLRLVRPCDLVVIVARYGHTERRHLLATAKALTAANRPSNGVIFNAIRKSTPRWIERIGQIGG